MDGIASGGHGGADDIVHVKVAFGRVRGTDANGLVGEFDVQAVLVAPGVNGNAADAQFLAGTDDPQGDLAPVGDQDLVRHRILRQAITIRTWS